ncbi:uncharacterized protein VTP21DRAFT_11439 [Calcarisporiella thermophila]|uniref:uncharacterized protein n=1 Tax=Calcarisporiella thermophila TaxID=911321 RepID=UPI0037436149
MSGFSPPFRHEHDHDSLEPLKKRSSTNPQGLLPSPPTEPTWGLVLFRDEALTRSPGEQSSTTDANPNRKRRESRRQAKVEELALVRHHIESGGKSFKSITHEEEPGGSVAMMLRWERKPVEDLLDGIGTEDVLRLAHMTTESRLSRRKRKLRYSSREVLRDFSGDSDDFSLEDFISDKTRDRSRRCKELIQYQYSLIAALHQLGREYNPLRIIRRRDRAGKARRTYWLLTPEDWNNHYDEEESEVVDRPGSALSFASAGSSVEAVVEDDERIHTPPPPTEASLLPKSTGSATSSSFRTAPHDSPLLEHSATNLLAQRISPERRPRHQKRPPAPPGSRERRATSEEPSSGEVGGIDDELMRKRRSWTNKIFGWRPGGRELEEHSEGNGQRVHQGVGLGVIYPQQKEGTEPALFPYKEAGIGRVSSLPVNPSGNASTSSISSTAKITRQASEAALSGRMDLRRLIHRPRRPLAVEDPPPSDESEMEARDFEPEKSLKEIGERVMDNEERRDEGEVKREEDENEQEEQFNSEEQGVELNLEQAIVIDLDLVPKHIKPYVEHFRKWAVLWRQDEEESLAVFDPSTSAKLRFEKLIDGGDQLINLVVLLVSESDQNMLSEIEGALARYQRQIAIALDFVQHCELNLQQRAKFLEEFLYDLESDNESLSTMISMSSIPTNASVSTRPPSSIIIHSEHGANSTGSGSFIPSQEFVYGSLHAMSADQVRTAAGLDILDALNRKIVGQLRSLTADMTEMMAVINEHNFHTVKALEDDIQIINAVRAKSPWLDIGYVVLEYMVTGLAIVFWLVVTVLRAGRKYCKSVWHLAQRGGLSIWEVVRGRLGNA